MRSNVLVTGGAGFIGANFVRHMMESTEEVKIIVLDSLTYAGNLDNLSGLNAARLKFVKGDITDASLVESLFEKEKIDAVVNFAAESHVDRSILGPAAFVETNIMGTFVLLEAARKAWNSPEALESARFVHVSTDEVYGSLGETGYFTEETPYSPNSPYSASKASSDHLVRAYFHTYGLPVLTTNCSNNYGPYQFPEKLIPLMVLNALEGKPLPVYGDGKNVRDWLYVTDHCKAIEAVLDRGRLGETYNIGGRCEMQNIEIVNLVCSEVDFLVELDEGLALRYPYEEPRKALIKYVTDRPGHDRRYAIDCQKIETELGWKPEVTFEEGMKQTIEWYVTNRSWWEAILSGEYLKYYDEQYGNRG